MSRVDTRGQVSGSPVRQEDAAEWPRIMHAALGLEAVFPGRPVNAAGDKPYAVLYDEFMKRFRYTDEESRLLDDLLTSRKYYAV